MSKRTSSHQGSGAFVQTYGGPGPAAWSDEPEKLSEHVTTEECNQLNLALKPHKDLSEARHLIRFFCENADFQNEIPDLSSGCLYLPTNAHMQQLYEGVEHPYPHDFANMIREWLFSEQDCPADHETSDLVANSRGSSVRTCSIADGHGLVGQHGACLEAEQVEEVASLRVHSFQGLLGLDARWQKMVDERAASPRVVPEMKVMASNSGLDVTIPVEYIVCDPGDGSIDRAVTDRMIRDQNDVLNSDWSGGSSCDSNMTYTPQYFDTRVRFSLKSITRMTNRVCRSDCNDRISSLTRDVAPREDGVLKVVICQTRLLGRASFPGDSDSRRICLMRPGALPGGATSGYNLGKTLSHEIGHYLGLYHTFQSGCSGGDQVSDTEPEKSPNYGCPESRSWRRNTCGGPDQDPIHNVMDYSNDRCMCSFTRGQRDRVWSQMDLMPDYLALATRR